SHDRFVICTWGRASGSPPSLLGDRPGHHSTLRFTVASVCSHPLIQAEIGSTGLVPGPDRPASSRPRHRATLTNDDDHPTAEPSLCPATAALHGYVAVSAWLSRAPSRSAGW